MARHFRGVDGAEEEEAFGEFAGEEELAIGCFVFLRNARFRPDAETPDMPRYWVARVTGITLPPAPGAGGGSMVLVPGRGMVPVPAPAAMPRQVLATDDGKLRLQWLRETRNGGGMFTASAQIFFEHRRLVRALPGGMRYEPVLQVWRRGADGETAPPLVFPGDESLIAAKLLNDIKPGAGPLPPDEVIALLRANGVALPAFSIIVANFIAVFYTPDADAMAARWAGCWRRSTRRRTT